MNIGYLCFNMKKKLNVVCISILHEYHKNQHIFVKDINHDFFLII